MTTLTDDQKEVQKAFRQFYTSSEQFLTINGAAGTGKSTVLNLISENNLAYQETLKLLQPSYMVREVIFTTVTNKAVNELASKIKDPFITLKTIHSLLGLRPTKGGLTYTRSTSLLQSNLKNCIIVIDECSLMDDELCSIILKIAEEPSIKFMFVGDSNQLPPIGQDSISQTFGVNNSVKLNQVVRQQDALLQVVTQFRDFVELDKYPQFVPDNITTLHLPRDEFDEMIKKDMTSPGWSNKDSRFVTFDNTTVNKYNKLIKAHITGSSAIQAGEMVVNNSYINPSRTGITIPTEAMVFVSKVQESFRLVPCYVYDVIYKNETLQIWMPKTEQDAKNLKKKLEAGEGNEYLRRSLGDLRPIYASTVHKAQGSTFKRVYVDLNSIKKCKHFNPLLFKRLLYVAVSRASEQIVFTGDI